MNTFKLNDEEMLFLKNYAQKFKITAKEALYLAIKYQQIEMLRQDAMDAEAKHAPKKKVTEDDEPW